MTRTEKKEHRGLDLSGQNAVLLWLVGLL